MPRPSFLRVVVAERRRLSTLRVGDIFACKAANLRPQTKSPPTGKITPIGTALSSRQPDEDFIIIRKRLKRDNKAPTKEALYLTLLPRRIFKDRHSIPRKTLEAQLIVVKSTSEDQDIEVEFMSNAVPTEYAVPDVGDGIGRKNKNVIRDAYLWCLDMPGGLPPAKNKEDVMAVFRTRSGKRSFCIIRDKDTGKAVEISPRNYVYQF